MVNYLLVAVGSAVGGMARYACSGLAVRYISETFPWGTLLINVSGSLVIGVLAVVIPLDGRWLMTPDARALLMVGLCGGFTTFSAFSLETLNLARNGAWAAAGGYIVGSLVLCIAAAAIGYFGATLLQR
jgi:CrcB protein